jgi:molybdopterin/thiamine biosynthesis adenylyltransferase
MTSLMDLLSERMSGPDQLAYRPEFFRLVDTEDRERLARLLTDHPDMRVYDSLERQLAELWWCRNPGHEDGPHDVIRDLALADCDTSLLSCGVWVFYPWSGRLVHLLDEAEFVEVRTNRNQLKITKEEQSLLRTKRIGIVGLSVGSAIAMTLAIERCCGELRLADFDTLELSNLNRVRAPVHTLTLPKVLVIAREIAELDPFIGITCFFDRIDRSNLEEFLLHRGRLDLCIEECDDLSIKVLVRRLAKQHRIPVMMETNERGMLDVERYDLDPDWPLLHGRLPDLERWDLERICNLTVEEKVPYVMDIVGRDILSERSRVTLREVGKSVRAWPQLSSAVTRGAGVAADAARQILLNHCTASGRFYSVLSESHHQDHWQDAPMVVPAVDTST